MIEVAEAKRILLDQAQPLPVVEAELGDALGRVLADPALADRDLPAGDVSTMDGYALRSADALVPGSRLRVAGEVRAGQPPPGEPLRGGEALRIFTGALVPPGADSVAMVERTSAIGADAVEFLDTALPGQNIRRRGEDVRRGDQVVPAGSRIRAAEAAALAGVGATRVRVHRAPKVGIVSTGDELVGTSDIPLPHQVRNSNAAALAAQLAEMGIDANDFGVAPDDEAALRECLRAGLAGDVLLVTGGVSAGRYDLVRDVLRSLGMDVLFHGVAVRPGKPLLAGRCGGCLVAGLPGNPVSAFTTFAVFIAPALRRLEGARVAEAPELTATLAEPLAAKPGRATYHLARVDAEAGRLVARPVRSQGSGDFVSLVRANAFIVTPAEAGALPVGAEVTTVRFGSMPW